MEIDKCIVKTGMRHIDFYQREYYSYMSFNIAAPTIYT